MIVYLHQTKDIFNLSVGDNVTKRNLFDLIQYSKVDGSIYWSGPENRINNTPQQGINWIGDPPYTRAVIVKTRPGSYEHDGWTDSSNDEYNYSFKVRRGGVSFKDKSNLVLVEQPQYLYPVLLFSEVKEGWSFEGVFGVSEIKTEYVVLKKILPDSINADPEYLGKTFYEGEKVYVTHLLAERNKTVVDLLKSSNSSVCDICRINFNVKYGFDYIEAHHKVPMHYYSGEHAIDPSDFALLCPNCHKAVHIHMKEGEALYDEIKSLLLDRFEN